MPVSKSRAAKTAAGERKSSEAPAGKVWDKTSKVDEYDGRKLMGRGDFGREPGGRWSPPAFERPAAIITQNIIRKPGRD